MCPRVAIGESRATLEDIQNARALVFALARDGDRRWRMSVPPQDDDSDMLLLRVIDSAEEALFGDPLATKESQP